jgi:hypothetical protein
MLFAAVFMGLATSGYWQNSATIDEPQHLTLGYAALKLGDYRLDIEHPPFLRMWAALPLLITSDVRFNTNTVLWSSVKPARFSHGFLYVDNDADRLLSRARFMIVLLGVLLGVFLFCWARELFGVWPAILVLGLFTLEPTILAHFGVVTTDAGATCFIFGSVYFLWRTTKRVSGWNLTGLIVFFALAQISKFSALILVPIAVVLLAFHGYRTQRWKRALGITVALAVVTYVAIWAAYGFRYAPGPQGSGLDRIVAGPAAHARVPQLAAVIDWIDQYHLLPNAYAQGFLLGQAAAQDRTGYLFGQIRFTGWWYYFPVALLLKTPVSLIVLVIAGLAVCTAKRSERDLYFVVPFVVYLLVSMTAKLNIGVRHVLPIYPFALMMAGRAVAEVLAGRRPLLRAGLAGLCLLLVAEVLVAQPYNLAFFNCLVGGPKNGYKYLADSNLDWGQDLKRLKQWMQSNDVDWINLSYFGSADPAYYGIHCNYLRGSPLYVKEKIQDSVLPGLVAVSVNNLTGAGLDGGTFYKPLLDAKPVALIGYSIRIYRVEKPWW